MKEGKEEIWKNNLPQRSHDPPKTSNLEKDYGAMMQKLELLGLSSNELEVKILTQPEKAPGGTKRIFPVAGIALTLISLRFSPLWYTEFGLIGYLLLIVVFVLQQRRRKLLIFGWFLAFVISAFEINSASTPHSFKILRTIVESLQYFPVNLHIAYLFTIIVCSLIVFYYDLKNKTI
jgi:hypothetical protein